MRTHLPILAGAIVMAATTACSPVLGTSSSPVPAPSLPAAMVQRGDIQQSASFSGDVRAQNQITVLPKVSGRVLQAQANLSAAQAKLETIQAGARPDDVAQVQDALAQQQAKLAGLQAQGRPEDVAAAQAALAAQQAKLSLLQQGGRPDAIAQATAQVDAAAQKLALVQKGATDDVRQAA